MGQGVASFKDLAADSVAPVMIDGFRIDDYYGGGRNKFLHGGNMPLNIKNTDAHRLAKELASLTGRSITDVVTAALRDALGKTRSLRVLSTKRLVSALDEIAEQCASLEVIDGRTADEILGYNETGVPE